MKKVIGASAGTGKTYRLSLEFINILLSPRNSTSYEEILMITFTRKATSEIRERILTHLELITSTQQSKRDELLLNLKKINPNISLEKSDLVYLRAVQKEILLNKNKLKVSTIDAFVNQIFKNLIAPKMNVMDYQIDPNINDEYLGEIFEQILSKKYFSACQAIFHTKKGKNLSAYENFIKDIIRYRWMFYCLENNKVKFKPNMESIEKLKVAAWSEYAKTIERVITAFSLKIKSKKMKGDWQKLLKKSYLDLMRKYGATGIQISNLALEIKNLLLNKQMLFNNYTQLFKRLDFWNGHKFRGFIKEMENDLKNAQNCLADFLLLQKFIPEQEKIIEIARIILAKYDKIKLREKIFTYDDILFYTYHFLHNPEFSIIDEKNVLNVFYEQLSYNIRFVLIDEFQDTSVLQWNILYPLISEVISGMGQKEQGGVVLVGDEKQSIYGWRGGERDLLKNAPQFLEMGKTSSTLSTSFRSNRTIVGFVNSFFGNSPLHRILKDNTIHWDYDRISSNETEKRGYVEIQIRDRKESKPEKKEISEIEIYEDFVRDRLKPLLDNEKINIAETAILARKNKELETIAAVCNNFGIPYYLASANSITAHRAIKPLLYLLKYFVHNDIYDLIAFLRSNLILMPAHKLKKLLLSYRKILDNGKGKSSRKQFFEVNNKKTIMVKISKVAYKPDSSSILKYIKSIFEEFEFTKIFSTESDLQNIHRFLEIVTEFENLNKLASKNLNGFLDFCDKIEKDESYSQVGITETKAIKLLSVHKSKGLEFENVIAFFNLKGSKGNFGPSLKKYFQYNHNFSGFQEVWLSFNYDKIFRNSSKNVISDQLQIKEYIETLNTFYVALTRARSNLFVIGHFTLKKFSSFQKFQTSSGNLKLPNLLFGRYYSEFKENFKQRSPFHAVMQKGSLVQFSPEKKSKAVNDLDFPAKYFSIEKPTSKSVSENYRKTNFAKNYLQEKSILKGNIVHHYLSLIIYAGKEERKFAFNSTCAEFGGLLPISEIKKLIHIADEFIQQNKRIFSKVLWHNIFNEYIIFDKNGNEFRLDRMLVNRTDKRILIIDFKTGKNYDEQQLSIYKRIVRDIPFVKENNYTVSGEFLEIELE